MDLFDAKTGVWLFVLYGLLVTLSALLLDDLLECALCVFGDYGGDLDCRCGKTGPDVSETVWQQPRGPRIGEWEQWASCSVVGCQTCEETSGLRSYCRRHAVSGGGGGVC